jgi:acyl-coenzyme A thioesterase PaaI-like protein
MAVAIAAGCTGLSTSFVDKLRAVEAIGMQTVDNATDRIKDLKNNAPNFIRLLGGELVELAVDQQKATFVFTVPLDYCHSGDIVQGGFITAMLDAAMSHAAFGTDPTITGIASLDISTQYLGICRGGQALRVSGWIKKATHRTAFLEAHIVAADDAIVATAQSVAKLSRPQAS